MEEDHPLDSLSRDELLVLFEWAYRFCETKNLAFSHHAEAVVIDKIATELEREMPEPFNEKYPNLIRAAQARILRDYESQMGKNTWIHRQPLNQT